PAVSRPPRSICRRGPPCHAFGLLAQGCAIGNLDRPETCTSATGPSASFPAVPGRPPGCLPKTASVPRGHVLTRWRGATFLYIPLSLNFRCCGVVSRPRHQAPTAGLL